MTRINAGSTLANQYAPPFVVSKSVATNWQLRYNANILAFEAFDPAENVVVSGFDSIDVKLFTDVSQQVFVVDFATDSKESVIITIDGVKQQQNAYSWRSDTASNTTTITLADTVSVETVEILGLQTTGGASVEVFGPQAIDSNIAGTVNAYFDLNWFAPSVESLIVTIDGVKQTTNNYYIEPTPGSNFTSTRVTFPDRTITFLTNASGVNAANEIITTDTNHGFTTGQGLYYSNDGGARNVGLTNNTLYYVAVLSTYTIALHTTRDNAINDAGNGDPNRVDINVDATPTAETHALTLIADPYLYINGDTIAINAGGIGYSPGDVISVNSGSPIIEAQIRVNATDSQATFTFNTDGSGNIPLGAITITDGGSGYVSGGFFTITTNSGVAGNNDAVVTFTQAGGVIDTAIVTTPGTGYTASQTGVSVHPLDAPDPTLGAITDFTLLHAGEYVVFPTPNPVATSTTAGGSGATFNIFRISPQLEIIGITLIGETPASPVQVANLAGGTAAPGSPTTGHARIFSSKIVSGETQIFGLRDLFAGTNITLTEGASSITIDAAQLALTQSGAGGATLFDNNDPAAGVFKTIQAVSDSGRIDASVTIGATPNQVLVIEYGFGYLSSADATITLTTERLVNVLPAAATTVNLPAAATVTAGDTITIKDGNGSAGSGNTIAVTPNGLDEIDGVNAAVTLTTTRAYITLYSDGADWHIIGQG